MHACYRVVYICTKVLWRGLIPAILQHLFFPNISFSSTSNFNILDFNSVIYFHFLQYVFVRTFSSCGSLDFLLLQLNEHGVVTVAMFHVSVFFFSATETVCGTFCTSCTDVGMFKYCKKECTKFSYQTVFF